MYSRPHEPSLGDSHLPSAPGWGCVPVSVWLQEARGGAARRVTPIARRELVCEDETDARPSLRTRCERDGGGAGCAGARNYRGVPPPALALPVPRAARLLYGLQRSGTNFLEALVAANFVDGGGDGGGAARPAAFWNTRALAFDNDAVPRTSPLHKHFRLFDDRAAIVPDDYRHELALVGADAARLDALARDAAIALCATHAGGDGAADGGGAAACARDTAAWSPQSYVVSVKHPFTWYRSYCRWARENGWASPVARGALAAPPAEARKAARAAAREWVAYYSAWVALRRGSERVAIYRYEDWLDGYGDGGDDGDDGDAACAADEGDGGAAALLAAFGDRHALARRDAARWLRLNESVPHTRLWATDRLSRYRAARASGAAALCVGLEPAEADALARALEEGDGKATLAALRYELPNCGGVPDAG